jgi:parallel beta-helix repeat protein
VTINHNTIDQRDDPCPTAPIFIPDQGNAGATVTDNVVAGGGYSIRLTGGTVPTVTGNKVVNNTWGYGPLDVECSIIGTWSGNATITFDWSTGTILSQVQALNNC